MAKKLRRAVERPKLEIRRVYFIGAGFSAGTGYPVGATLVPSLIEWLRRKKFRQPFDEERKRLILETAQRLLRRYLAVSLDLQKATEKELHSAFSKVNVAEFYSTAHAIADMPHLFDRSTPSAADSNDMSLLYEGLAAATRSYFWELSNRVEHLPRDMDELLDGIRASAHAIINFNWDEEVDIKLSTWGRDSDPDEDHMAYTLGGWTRRRFVHLKPHGSIGWYDLRQGIGNDSPYFIARDDRRLPRGRMSLIAYADNELPLDLDGSPHPVLDCPPVVMPPTFSKRFIYPEQQTIWQDVLDVCTNADEFIFVGYSIPADDFLTRAAIRRAFDDRDDRHPMKCLVVGRSCGEQQTTNLASVFPGFDPARNFLQWSFGSKQANARKAALASQLEGRMTSATLNGSSTASNPD